MRYGVLADIHGNLPALRTAVAQLRAEGVDRFLCAGDVVGYGPFPNECLELVAGLEPLAVHGNHDLIALGHLSDERCIPLARASLAWTRRRLSSSAREWLESLPPRVTLDGLVMAHGSLDDPQCYIRDGAAAARELARLRAILPHARVLILGHTHLARAWGPRAESLLGAAGAVTQLAADGPTLLNPGAVGQSRERRALARSLVLDEEQGCAIFQAQRYDLRGYRRALRRAGFPTESAHLSPTFFGRSTRKLRRLVERNAYPRRRPHVANAPRARFGR
jgi:predicted phosphodiesterase